MKSQPGRERRYAVFIVVLIVALLAMYPKSSIVVYENAMLAFFPSAARAANYGSWHFESSKPRLYDVSRAYILYKKAAALDSKYPYVHHQLARIAFLRSDFRDAIWHINKEIEVNAHPSPSSYYVRGLIEGYMGLYDDAARDYAIFLKSRPNNWAALNDYAWVLLKSGRIAEARDATDRGLAFFPENPWLLNSNAIAHFELGNTKLAGDRAEKAVAAAAYVTEQEWLTAYPGNDPAIAREGIAALRRSTLNNMHRIEDGFTSAAVQ